MKKFSFLLLFMLIAGLSAFAQDVKPTVPKQFMQITTVESVVAGGLCRSRMMLTNADGTQS